MEESCGDFQKLPEGCISHVISLTSPRDTCRSSVISSTFRSAIDSDAVWEKFLPSDYGEILSRAVDSVEYSSKKDLYFRLCDSILIDGGKLSFALEKSSGGKCYMVPARELGIVWGDTPQYWRWISLPESRFSEVGELLHVCWLEIHGKIDCRMLTRKTTYRAYLVYKLVDGAHGFDYPAQAASLKVGAHESRSTLFLKPFEGRLQTRSNRMFRPFLPRHGRMAFPLPTQTEEIKDAKTPRARGDGWMEIEMGEFFNDEGEDGVVDMWFQEVKGGHWKSGLIVQGIDVRPKK